MPPKGRIEVKELTCKGCNLCVGACPQHVIALSEGINPKGYHPATLVAEGCTGCGICALMCPEAAISVYRETANRLTKAEA
ncbi:MAG TPA: ferredoxin family protein [Anaerolineaceae bacterium]|jgi:2-oxoglutarate ferredoxin oxidoreductase subunit delta|nr:ferredoxin family protein [Anaerolineaceae bacterium]